MKKLLIILFLIPCFLQAQKVGQKTVTISGNLIIDSLRIGTISDTLMVIKNGEVKKSVPLSVFIIAHMRDSEIMNMINPIEGLLVYNLDLHKFFMYSGQDWEMINSLIKVE